MFRRGIDGLWQTWEVSFGCACHEDFKKKKKKKR